MAYLTSFLFKESEASSHQRKALISVVGREYCFESTKELPISKLDEAVKAAELLDDVAPFEGRRFFLVDKTNTDRSRITFFVVKEEGMQQIEKKAWFVLPEPLLVKLWMDAQAKNDNALLKSQYDDRVFSAYRSDSEFRSMVSLNSASQNTWLASQFTASASSETTLDEVQYKKLLLDSFKYIPGYVLPNLFNKKRAKQTFSGVPWLRGATVFTILFALYIGFSSLFLLLRTSQIEQELTAQRGLLNDVFAMQTAIEQESAQLESLSKDPKIKTITSDVWPVLFELLRHKDVDFLSIRFESGEFILRAKSNKATDVIERLSLITDIVGTEMTSPVVKSRGKEVFTFKFKLNVEKSDSQEVAHVNSEQ